MPGAEEAVSDSALIVPVVLPRRLEAIRRRCVPDAAIGLPAHLTMLYPFASPVEIESALLDTVAAVVARHPAVTLRLVAGAEWPETVWVSVEPEEPIRTLQRDLAAAFPGFPLYGGRFPFHPHVTVAEGRVDLSSILADEAWNALPAPTTAQTVDLIVREATRWRVRNRFSLAGQ